MKTQYKLRFLFFIIAGVLFVNIIQLSNSNEEIYINRIPSSGGEFNLTWDYWTDISIGDSNVVFNYGEYNGKSNVLQLNQENDGDGDYAIARGTFPTPLDEGSIEFNFALGTQSGSDILVFARNINEELLFGVRMLSDNRIMIYDCQSKFYPHTVDNCLNWVNMRIEFDNSNERYDIYCDQVKIAENLLYYSYYVSSDATAVDMIAYTVSSFSGDYTAYLDNVVIESDSITSLNAPVLNSIPSPDSDGNYTVSWSSVSGAETYQLYRSLSSIGDVSGLSPIYDGTEVSYLESSIAEGTYYYCVVATNSSGTSPLSNNVIVDVVYPVLELLPAPVLNSIPSPDSDGNYTVSWSSVSGAETYQLYRSLSSIGDISVLSPIYDGTEVSYLESSIAEGTYYYCVVATNSSGTSPLSNIVSVDVEYPGGEFNLTWDYWTDISIGDSNVVFNYGEYNGKSNVLQLNQENDGDGDYAIARGTFPTPLDKGSIEFNFALGTQTGSDILVFARNSNEELLFGVRMLPDNRIMIYDCQSKSYPHTVDNCLNWVNMRIEFDNSNERYDIYCDQVKIAENLLYYSYYVSSDATAVDMIAYTVSSFSGDYTAYLDNVVIESDSIISLNAPILNSIPSPDSDGNYTVSWSSVSGAETYQLYRSLSSFTDISGISPIYDGTGVSYLESSLAEGTYYYCVVATNSLRTSPLSNMVSVDVEYPNNNTNGDTNTSTPFEIPGFSISTLTFFIFVGICSLLIFHRRLK